MADEGMIAETISINGDKNTLISAYAARPLPSARVAVALTPRAAKELGGALARAIKAAEIEEDARSRGV